MTAIVVGAILLVALALPLVLKLVGVLACGWLVVLAPFGVAAACAIWATIMVSLVDVGELD